MEHNDCLYVASVSQQRVRKTYRTISLVCKITFKQIVEVLLQYFYKPLEQHRDNLFDRSFADLGHVFAKWVD